MMPAARSARAASQIVESFSARGEAPRCIHCNESENVELLGAALRCASCGEYTTVAGVVALRRKSASGVRKPLPLGRPVPVPASAASFAQPRRLLRPGERVRALAGLGPVVRLPTGIPTLDHACRGGLPTRRLVVLGGAPGAGKTSVATWWAWNWAKAGIPVGVLAVDEGPEGTLTRIAQLEGFAPDRLEERDPAALASLAELLDASALILVDGEDEAGSVEGVAELVGKAAAGGLGVLIVDSIQTVRAAGTDNADSARERVDAVVRALKTARDRYGLLVVATCELARGAYRSRNLAEAINDLAAFKESGSVEYAAQTALVLRSVPDEPSLVDVTVPKNRAYRREPFRLQMSHATTAYSEVELPSSGAAGGGSGAKDGDRFLALRRSVVDVVGAAELRSARSIARAVRDAGHRFRDADIFDAVKVMSDEGALVREGREPYRIAARESVGGASE